ncbi:hypothetical protein Pmani_025483 [Petrolisthes manimaculis]|uniref:Uncharacterized protein n=1 Tax=Petrolisthes manimaculis TaxID=1843537 RepID=A0AAE1P848_9EUCA|nr:hypothetical protein Pmani_025483 [Petrolisthes manimaculis]
MGTGDAFTHQGREEEEGRVVEEGDDREGNRYTPIKTLIFFSQSSVLQVERVKGFFRTWLEEADDASQWVVGVLDDVWVPGCVG